MQQRRPRELRIIAGEWRGRKLRFPAETSIRPTPDRVRETLFNWIGPRVRGVRALDLFAGSGVLGLEALSRGAASATFVDSDPRALQALRERLAEWRSQSGTVIRAEAQAFLAARRATASAPVMSVASPSPSPSASAAASAGPSVAASAGVGASASVRAGGSAGTSAVAAPAPDGTPESGPFGLVFLDPPFAAGLLPAVMRALESGGWLAPGALVYVEAPAPDRLPEWPSGWELLRSGTAGAVGYHLLCREGRRVATGSP